MLCSGELGSCTRSTLNIVRASGRQLMPGCAVPVQEEAYQQASALTSPPAACG